MILSEEVVPPTEVLKLVRQPTLTSKVSLNFILSWEEELIQNSIELSIRDSVNQDLIDILSPYQESQEFLQRILKSLQREKINLMEES